MDYRQLHHYSISYFYFTSNSMITPSYHGIKRQRVPTAATGRWIAGTGTCCCKRCRRWKRRTNLKRGGKYSLHLKILYYFVELIRKLTLAGVFCYSFPNLLIQYPHNYHCTVLLLAILIPFIHFKNR
jgi:hypothetical protein